MNASTPEPPKTSRTPFWWIQEEERIIGPYTGKQMLSFLLRGRLRPASLVRSDTESDWRAAAKDPEFARYFESSSASPAGTHQAGRSSSGHRMPNYLIMVDGDAYPDRRIEAVVGELGPYLRLMPYIWLLHCGLPVEKIRTYLVRQLGAIEGLFIVDVPRGSYVFHKFDEKLEQRIGALLEPPEEAPD